MLRLKETAVSFRTKFLVFALLLIPGLALGQESTIRDLTDLTGSPSSTMAFEIETSANTSGFLTLSSTESVFEGFLDLQDLQGAVTDGQVPNSITIDFTDPDSNWTATTLDAALAELDNVINSGNPNAATGKVDWSQLVNVPAGFADGTDDGDGGGGETNTGSSLGGGLAIFAGKSGVDLQFNSANASDFDLGSNVLSIDDATWLNEAELDTFAELQSQIADQTLINLSEIDSESEFETLTGWDVVTPSEIAGTLEKNFSFYHSSDLTTYDAVAKIQFANAVTITEIACATDTGTVSINLEERGETTPNTTGTDAIGSDLVCDNNQQDTTTFSNAGFDADDWATVTISAVASSPTIVNITVKYTLQ